MKPNNKKSMIPTIIFSIVALLMVALWAKTYVLASELNGTLLDKNNHPVPDITIERDWTWSWNSKTGKQTTTTDENGNFHFPQVTGRSISAGMLPHEPVVTQKVKVLGETGAELLFVQNRTYEPGGEFGYGNKDSKTINVNCRIDLEPSTDGFGWGTCVLKEDFEKTK